MCPVPVRVHYVVWLLPLTLSFVTNLCEWITGSTLVKCGQTQQKLGQAKRDLMQATTNGFLLPLKTFLDTDVKSIQVSNSCHRVVVPTVVPAWLQLLPALSAVAVFSGVRMFPGCKLAVSRCISSSVDCCQWSVIIGLYVTDAGVWCDAMCESCNLLCNLSEREEDAWLTEIRPWRG